MKLGELTACKAMPTQDGGHAGDGASLPSRADCRQEACPTCGLYFAGLSSTRKHHAKKHGASLVNPEVKDSKARAALDLTPRMVDGTPHCHREHITARCPMLHGSGAKATPADAGNVTQLSAGAPLGHTCQESPSVPAVRKESVHQTLQRKPWRELFA